MSSPGTASKTRSKLFTANLFNKKHQQQSTPSQQESPQKTAAESSTTGFETSTGEEGIGNNPRLDESRGTQVFDGSLSREGSPSSGPSGTKRGESEGDSSLNDGDGISFNFSPMKNRKSSPEKLKTKDTTPADRAAQGSTLVSSPLSNTSRQTTNLFSTAGQSSDHSRQQTEQFQKDDQEVVFHPFATASYEDQTASQDQTQGLKEDRHPTPPPAPTEEEIFGKRKKKYVVPGSYFHAPTRDGTDGGMQRMASFVVAKQQSQERGISPPLPDASTAKGGFSGGDDNDASISAGSTGAEEGMNNPPDANGFPPTTDYVPKPYYDISDIPQYPTSRRAENLRTLIGKEAPPFVIPHYEQACFKYMFREAFDEGLDMAEIQALGGLVISAIINLAVVTINVFIPDSSTQSKVVSTEIMTFIVFILEFVAVAGMLLVAVGIVVESIIRKQVTTDTAIDFVEVSVSVGSFSSLQAVNVVSPAVVVNQIMPQFTSARTAYEHARAIIMAVVWLCLCVLACLAVVLKVSQVGFASTVPITDWSTFQVLKMLGLVLNLAKVDQSYDAELSTCLKALHQHYFGPGGPDSINPKSEGFYSRWLQWLGIPRKNSYEYFECVFNHHFGDEELQAKKREEEEEAKNSGRSSNNGEDVIVLPDEEEPVDLMGDIKKALNFGAFITKLNPVIVQKYLQMIHSPLPHYVLQRKEFTEKRIRGIIEKNHQDVFVDRPGRQRRDSSNSSRDEAPRTRALPPPADGVQAEHQVPHEGELQHKTALQQVVDAMETAIKHADPGGDDILDQGHQEPSLFRLTFVCEDEDEDYADIEMDLGLGLADHGGVGEKKSVSSHTPGVSGEFSAQPSFSNFAPTPKNLNRVSPTPHFD